jgi:hypothetical protein
MNSNPNKYADVTEVIERLRNVNIRIQRLLESIPTSEDRVLAELDSLINTQRSLMNIPTTREKGTMFYEQACGIAASLRDRYIGLLHRGGLRKSL